MSFDYFGRREIFDGKILTDEAFEYLSCLVTLLIHARGSEKTHFGDVLPGESRKCLSKIGNLVKDMNEASR